jgi:conjugal transfer pilin signal peptidase TrbI
MKLKRLNNYQKKLLKISVIIFTSCYILVLCVSKILINNGYSFKINVTSSLPERFWVINNNKTTNFKVGDYIVFYAPNDKMLTNGKNTPVIKIVVGVGGDKIVIKNKMLFINNKFYGFLFEKTRNGNILTPIKSQIIQANCYFAYTPAMYSYDSRYSDIGILCEKNHRIIASAHSLF